MLPLLYPQKLRHTLAETIHRLPHHELVRPFAEDLMRVMLNVLRDDNEENAVVALKVIIDLHRSYKSVLQDHVQPFLELVQAFYNNMKNTVNEAFKSDSAQTQSVPGQAANLVSLARLRWCALYLTNRQLVLTLSAALDSVL